ncbi:MAG: hypothetical protein NVS4B3_01330 [Gemmatimonadaceae bacterium]
MADAAQSDPLEGPLDRQTSEQNPSTECEVSERVPPKCCALSAVVRIKAAAIESETLPLRWQLGKGSGAAPPPVEPLAEAFITCRPLGKLGRSSTRGDWQTSVFDETELVPTAIP